MFNINIVLVSLLLTLNKYLSTELLFTRIQWNRVITPVKSEVWNRVITPVNRVTTPLKSEVYYKS